MKRLAMIWFLALTLVAGAQRDKTDLHHIDMQVRNVGFAPPADLARQLTVNCNTDLEKTRAIFRWIAENISYRTRTTVRRKKQVYYDYEEPHDTVALKPLDERVAETVLENRVAVCDGYARLFKTLCTYAGVKAETISGYARTDLSRTRQRFAPNHTWNAVWIDSSWKLLDVTWASGYISRQGDNFVRLYDDQYFLTSPEEFIREHYPDDLNWALMTDPPLMPEFRHSPFRQRSFAKYKISNYAPAKGVIDANEGDTLQFVLESHNIRADGQISPDPFLDTALYNTATTALLVPNMVKGNTTLYTYYVNSHTVQWLYVLYNDDLVLRYRLQVSKKTPGELASTGR